MSSDVRHFRRRFFGGFDASDVMAYIEELAGQRNKYKKSGDRLEAELKELNAEILRLQNEVDEADQRIAAIKIKALDEASGSISTLRDTYSNMRSEMESTTNTISSELSRLNNTLTLLSSVLDKTGSRFSELQTMLDRDKEEAFSSRAARFVH